jgi:hypothetical protein
MTGTADSAVGVEKVAATSGKVPGAGCKTCESITARLRDAEQRGDHSEATDARVIHRRHLEIRHNVKIPA